MTQSANDWYAQGLAFRNAGNASQAVTCFNQALMQQPDSKDACRALAVTLQETGQFGLAIKIYEHPIRPKRWRIWACPCTISASSNRRRKRCCMHCA